MPQTIASPLEHIADLSSAEDIFVYLDVPFDPGVLNVSRLHIMKRFGAYLDAQDLSAEDAGTAWDAARDALDNAYRDFVDSTPLAEKVFKVFRDEEAKRSARFVGIETLTFAE